MGIRKRRRLERENSLLPQTAWETIQLENSQLENWEEGVINHWDKRTRGAIKLKAIGQSPIDQVHFRLEPST